MATTPDTLAIMAARAKSYPLRFGAREDRFASLVKTYVDATDPEGLITTRGDLISGAALGVAQRLALGTSGQALVSDGTDAVWGQVSLAGLNQVVVKEATGTLSQANITAMNGAPVTLIADPGAGIALIVEEIELLHSYSTSAYTGGDDLQIEYSDGNNITLVDKTILTNASSTSRVIKPTIYNLDDSTGTGLGWAIVANKGVQVTNATAAFAAGNVANVLKWRVRYHLVTLLT